MGKAGKGKIEKDRIGSEKVDLRIKKKVGFARVSSGGEEKW